MALPQNAEMPREMHSRLREVGELWANSPQRPRIAPQVLKHWDDLITQWIESDLPIVIRKSSDTRGLAIKHASGRMLVFSDNSLAQWAFSRAFAGEMYSLADIAQFLEEDSIPFAYAAKASDRERATYACILSLKDNVNTSDWKLCHIEEIGLKTRKPPPEIDIAMLSDHFRKFISPSNHFLIPLAWAGLGEVPEIIEQIKLSDSR